MSYSIDICLICLKHSDNLKCSKSQDTNGTSFEDKLKDFVPEYELDLNIPTYICAEYGRELSRIYEFKRKCLRNKTAYKKYAQQITTTDSSYKYLSVDINPDLMNVKEEISDLEYQSEMNTVNIEEIIIKEEVLDDQSKSLLGDIKKETPDEDDTRNLNNIIEENMQISDDPTDKQVCHENDAASKCEICNKSFKSPKYLKAHQSVHLKVKHHSEVLF